MTVRRGPALDDPPASGPTPPAVLFVLPWLPNGNGGVDRVVFGLMAGFGAHTAYRPLLLANGPQRKVVRRTHGDHPPLFEFLLRPPLDERRSARSLLTYLIRLPVTLARFIAFVKRENIVTVNLHYPCLAAFTVHLARLVMSGAFNVVLSFHGSDLPTRGCGALANLMWRFVLRRSDAIVVCSQALGKELREFAPQLNGSVRVVLNAIDPDACRLEALRASLPPGLESHPYLLSVGKFERKKGHDVLIRSYERFTSIRIKEPGI